MPQNPAVPHSSTPWKVSDYNKSVILDATGNQIVSVMGCNEQSVATAAHVVECVNAASQKVA